MATENSAIVFYGYLISPEKDNKENIEDLADNADIKSEVIDAGGEQTSMIIGRKIKKSDIPGFEQITADELIEEIQGIERNKYIEELEERFDLQNVKPTLILTGGEV